MGQEKALLDWGGQPMVAAIALKLRTLCREVLIVADESAPYLGFVDRCVPDLFPGAGVLGGLHAGLTATPAGLTAVVGCDMPFVNPAVLERFALAAEGRNSVVLRRGAHVEPLHAVYSRDALPVIEAALPANSRSACWSGSNSLLHRGGDRGPGPNSLFLTSTRSDWRRARRSGS
jgi:molybdopterin-guanine dinucleotide biosynthesis protein A